MISKLRRYYHRKKSGFNYISIHGTVGYVKVSFCGVRDHDKGKRTWKVELKSLKMNIQAEIRSIFPDFVEKEVDD